MCVLCDWILCEYAVIQNSLKLTFKVFKNHFIRSEWSSVWVTVILLFLHKNVWKYSEYYFAKRRRKGWICIWSLVSWGKTEGFKLIISAGLSLIIRLIFLKLNLSLLNSAHTHNSESNTNTVSVVSDQCFILNQKYKEIFKIFDTRGRNLRIKVINIHHIVHVFHIHHIFFNWCRFWAAPATPPPVWGLSEAECCPRVCVVLHVPQLTSTVQTHAVSEVRLISISELPIDVNVSGCLSLC